MTKNEYISFRRDGAAGSPVVIAFTERVAMNTSLPD